MDSWWSYLSNWTASPENTDTSMPSCWPNRDHHPSPRSLAARRAALATRHRYSPLERSPSPEPQRRKLQEERPSEAAQNIELPMLTAPPDWNAAGKGLANLGNTCYFNVALQMLFSIPALTEYFTSGRYLQACPDSITTPAVGIMVHFALVLCRYWDGETPHEILHPHMFFRHFIEHFPTVSPFSQNDAHEALAFILDQLHEALKQSTGQEIPPPPKDGPNPHPATLRQMERLAQESWARHWRSTTSLLTQYLSGIEHSRLQCLSCGYVGHQFTPFSCLTLPFPEEDSLSAHLTLYDLLDNYCHKEQLDAENGWQCDSCHQRTQAFKRLTYWQLPSYLCITLKRFEVVSSYFGRNLTARKNRALVDYPLTDLDMSAYLTAGKTEELHTHRHRLGARVHADHYSPLYDLLAVIYHSGNRNYGHYTAAIKRGSQWWHFNDEHSTPLKEDALINDQAYVLLYGQRQHYQTIMCPKGASDSHHLASSAVV